MTDSTPTPEKQIAALTAERDEWRERHDDLVKLADRIEAERDRYRAALERIAVDHISISRNAAKRALNGGDDE